MLFCCVPAFCQKEGLTIVQSTKYEHFFLSLAIIEFESIVKNYPVASYRMTSAEEKRTKRRKRNESRL
jgi:hypothetical protein